MPYFLIVTRLQNNAFVKTYHILHLIRVNFRSFPGGSMVRESPCQCRRHGFDPWSGKTLQATEQLGPVCFTNTLGRLPWWRSGLDSTVSMCVQSLVGEPRPYMPLSGAKKKKLVREIGREWECENYSLVTANENPDNILLRWGQFNFQV